MNEQTEPPHVSRWGLVTMFRSWMRRFGRHRVLDAVIEANVREKAVDAERKQEQQT